MKKLLVTGGSGYLGSHVAAAATTWETYTTYFRNSPKNVPASRSLFCNLRDPQALASIVTDLKPDVIIHTACSDRTPESQSAIVPAARHVTEAARGQGIRLIHLSTDMVFDGETAPYTEESPPSPITLYGQAKFEAEQIVASLYPQAVIVRSSLIYGINPVDHQTQWMLHGIERGETVCLFTDEIRSPIWVNTLTSALLELAELDYTGVLHVASPQALSRWDFGLAMLHVLNKQLLSCVNQGTLAESGLTRPRDLTLEVSKAHQLLHTPLLSVHEVQQRLTPQA